MMRQTPKGLSPVAYICSGLGPPEGPPQAAFGAKARGQTGGYVVECQSLRFELPARVKFSRLLQGERSPLATALEALQYCNNLL